MTLGALGFLNPWLLLGLASLPAIWWLLRTTPPRPQRITFPPTRLLEGLETREQTPARSPWWLTALRMAAATLLILALAEPVLNPERNWLRGAGPVVIIIDNGWSAAPGWTARRAMAGALIRQAEAQHRPVLLVPTAPAPKATAPTLRTPTRAREILDALEPRPFAPDRTAALGGVARVLEDADGTSIVWLSDGLDHGKAAKFADALSRLASDITVVTGGAGEEPLGLRLTARRSGKLEAEVVRPGGGLRSGRVFAWSRQGQRLGEAVFGFAAGERRATAPFDMPLELSNQVARIEIAGERSAGAVHLLDARARWQRVGLVSGTASEQSQPLLAPLYYIERALAPYAELRAVRQSNVAFAVESLLGSGHTVSVLVLADIGKLVGRSRERVEAWVKKGGLLLRFAGPRLEKGGDDLLPVPLRYGSRTLGGAFSWASPQPLGAFDEKSPFAGLEIPKDVSVRRQVLADLARLRPESEVWARLADGTPLVTAARRGDGWLVLFHVTANSDWSNLPLSGLFVDMLRRIVALSNVSAGAPKTAGAGAKAVDASGVEEDEVETGGPVLAPLASLDGFGRLTDPPVTAQAIPAAELDRVRPGPTRPPGFYGPPGRARALNLIGPKTRLQALGALPAAMRKTTYHTEKMQPLKPALLMGALGLLFVDILAVLALQGALHGLGRATGGRRLRTTRSRAAMLAIGLGLGAATLALALTLAFGPTPARAGERARTQVDTAFALKAALKTRFAYVLTGDPATDAKSRLGLQGLNAVLTARTAVEPADPMGVDVTRDELAFFPLLYWPVRPDARPLDERTLARIDAYMKQGGMIIFDTQDAARALPSSLGLAGPGREALQRLIGKLDIPRLEPVPEGHVLTKSFYLLDAFPGRWDGGALWVEAQPSGGPESESVRRARRSDGVSSILITANDFAAAWAVDESNRPLYPVVPGGEGQRELAYRTGVNIVMYALTGNYKADQVHVPALLERLGQ